MNRDIDRQIAELMGYEAIIHPNLTKTWVIHKHGEYEYQPLPRYSTSWEEMGLLVEWLHGKGTGIRVELDIRDRTWCRLFLYDDVNLNWHTPFLSVEDSAPLALCKAVLSLPLEVLHA